MVFDFSGVRFLIFGAESRKKVSLKWKLEVLLFFEAVFFWDHLWDRCMEYIFQIRFGKPCLEKDKIVFEVLRQDCFWKFYGVNLQRDYLEEAAKIFSLEKSISLIFKFSPIKHFEFFWWDLSIGCPILMQKKCTYKSKINLKFCWVLIFLGCGLNRRYCKLQKL